jgi:hypothetical protein
MRAKINEIDTKKKKKKNQTMQRFNETKSWFFEKLNKIDKAPGKSG